MIWPRAVLLDTCAMVWWVYGDLSKITQEVLVHAGLADGIFISPISGWEIGLLSNPKSRRRKLNLLPDPLTWFGEVMTRPGVKDAGLSGIAAVSASFLPEPLHADPADRLLVARAPELGVPLLTGDRDILAYGEAGHVQALAC